MNSLSTPVVKLPGVGEKTAAKLNGLGLYTLGDFLTFSPAAMRTEAKP